MKETVTGIRQMVSDAIQYVKLQIEEGKLVGAQKASILISAAAVGVICMMLLIFTVFMFAMGLVAFLKTLMPEWLAFVSVGGALLVISLLIILLRKYIIIDPICRFITSQIFENEPK